MAETERVRRDRRARAAAEKAKAEAKRADSLAKSEAAKADTARAQADAAKAGAAAEEAKARADEVRANSEAARTAAEERRRRDELDATASERFFETGALVGTYGAGLAVGVQQSASLEKKFKAGVAAKNAELVAIAKKLKPMLSNFQKVVAAAPVKAGKNGKPSSDAYARRLRQSQLKAVVSTADKSGVTKIGRGAAGPATAASLLAMSLVSRVVADQSNNETVKTLINATATGEQVAAAVVVAKDLAARSAATTFVDTAALATVEEARAVSNFKSPPSAVSKAAKVAARFALPIVAGAAALIAFKTAAKAGESTGAAASEGAKAAGDVVTAGGVTFYEQARDAGYSKPRALAEAVVRGAYNTATFGFFSEKLSVPGSQAAQRGAFLNASAEAKTSSPPKTGSPTSPRQAASTAKPKSDGQTNAHVRVVAGRAVQVRGYQTPKG